jgi:hypothetical protein
MAQNGKTVESLYQLSDLIAEFKKDIESSKGSTGQKLPTVDTAPPDQCVFEIKVNNNFLCGVSRDADKKTSITYQESEKSTAQDMANNRAVYAFYGELWHVWLTSKGHYLNVKKISADAMDKVSQNLSYVYPPFVPIMRGVILEQLSSDSGTLGVAKYDPRVSSGLSQVVFVYNPWFVTNYIVMDYLVGKVKSIEQALMFTILHELSHVMRGHINEDGMTYSGVTHRSENVLQDVGINNFCMEKLKQPCGDNFLASGVYIVLVVSNSQESAKGVARHLESLFDLFVPKMSKVDKTSIVSKLQSIKPRDEVSIVLGLQIQDPSQIIYTIGNIVKYGFAAESKLVNDDINQKIKDGDVDIPDMPGEVLFKTGDVVIHLPTRSLYVILGRHPKKKDYNGVRIGPIADLRILVEVSNNVNFGKDVAKKTHPTNPDVYALDPTELIPVDHLALNPQKVITPGTIVKGPGDQVYKVKTVKSLSEIEIEPLTKEELEKINSVIRSNPKEYLENQLFDTPLPKGVTKDNVGSNSAKLAEVEDYIPPFRRLQQEDRVSGIDLANTFIEEPKKPTSTDYRYVGQKILNADF